MSAPDAVHTCKGTDDDGRPLKPARATCGNCGASWCSRCDPAPSALCHSCHGRGHSTAEIDPAPDIGAIMAYEQGDLDDAACLELFAGLVKSGAAWTLQGHYGRTAANLIERGYLSKGGEVLIDVTEESDR